MLMFLIVIISIITKFRAPCFVKVLVKFFDVLNQRIIKNMSPSFKVNIVY